MLWGCRSEVLTEALESPDNSQRWRHLDGKIPDKEELEAKISHIVERLNNKTEQLLEKELILEEVTILSESLREKAQAGRADTLVLAKQVNDYQAKLRSITRRMMATVSEVSMYQATSMTLQGETVELGKQVEMAKENMVENKAPTEDAERQWYRMERDRMFQLEMKTRKDNEMADQPGNITPTTAEPRPTAYIPVCG